MFESHRETPEGEIILEGERSSKITFAEEYPEAWKRIVDGLVDKIVADQMEENLKENPKSQSNDIRGGLNGKVIAFLEENSDVVNSISKDWHDWGNLPESMEQTNKLYEFYSHKSIGNVKNVPEEIVLETKEANR